MNSPTSSRQLAGLRRGAGGNKIQKFYRLNQYIFAPQLRVLDEKGKQVGLFKKEEALRKANELGLDLVEIAPNAKPPVAKIIDFKKFKYLEAKREQQIKKKAKEIEIKEIRLRPFIGEHDFEVKASQAESFLKQGNRIKLVIVFQGRELTKKEFGFKIVSRFSQRLTNIADPQGLPHFEGRSLVSLYAAVKKHEQNQNKENSQQKIQDH